MSLSELLKQILPYVLAWTRPHYLACATYEALPYQQTASPSRLYAATLDRDGTLRSWVQAVRVATTNDGSNYWTLDLLRLDTGATLATLTTSAIAANTDTTLSALGLDVALTASMLAVQIRATKTGTPGAVSLLGPALWVE